MSKHTNVTSKHTNVKQLTQESVKGYEAKHAFYLRPPKGESDDFHLVKENIHLHDGTVIPHVRLVRNFKRSFWVTKEGMRVHEQKKECEVLDRLNRYECTQSQLLWRAADVLGKPYFRGSMKELANSPYLYGTDIASTSLIKVAYSKRFPDLKTMNSVAVLDIETTLENDNKDKNILMATISFKDRVVTSVVRSFLEGYADVETRLREKLQSHLGDLVKGRGIQWELDIVDNEIEVLRSVFRRAHEWKPDFLTIWNINFELPIFMHVCQRWNVDIREILNDPCVPEKYRYFRYQEGKKIKVMASGKESPINFADQWHIVHNPASFYFIDSMCTYRRLRTQRGELPSYSLDYILELELGMNKLKVEGTEGLEGGEWHALMQESYPLDYVIYNVFDCISVELLDEKVKDLSIDVPSTCEYSDYANFESIPKRVADELHYWLQENFNSVLGSTGKDMKTDLDDLPPGNTDLIVNLKAYLVTDEGLPVLEGLPNYPTLFRVGVYDLDVAGAYPSNTIVFNLSRATCRRILCRVEDMDVYQMRMQTLNLSGGHTNSVEFCTAMFKLPTMYELLGHYQQSKQQ